MIPSISFVTVALSLLLLSNQFVETICAALPKHEAQTIRRRDFYNSLTDKALEFHHEKANEYRRSVDEHYEKLKKRQSYEWYPAGPEMYMSNFGYNNYFFSSRCEGPNRRYYEGKIVRTITYPDEVQNRQYVYWLNATSYSEALPAGSPLECNLYGWPQYKYHNATGDTAMCTDKIWDPAGQTWSLRSSSNSNIGWTTNNATYGDQTVRTIFDCLLNQVAVEYQKDHPSLGFKPVRYELEGDRYYRFYDNNNFAWFLGCLSSWEVNQNTIAKRDCFDCDQGNNPIWDFLPPKLHHPQADATPLQWYYDSLGYSGKYDWVSVATYWPQHNVRNITMEGRQCTQMAVSRPGLRHWTVKFFDTPSFWYPQKTNEWSWPTAWQGVTSNGVMLQEPAQS